MPTERCWNCNQVKRGVELCASDDRLCPDCYKANERQLKDQCAAFPDTAAAVMPADKSATPIDVVSQRLDDTSQSSADIKKTKSKSAKGKRIKDDSTPIQQGPPTADVAATRSAVLTQQNVATVTATDDISALRQLVHIQQGTIEKLQSQLNFILSFLGIDDTDVADGTFTEEVLDDTSPPADALSRPARHEAPVAEAAAANGVNSDHQLWSDVVSKRHYHQRVDTFKQSVVTALYVDQSLKRSRENSLIVTGFAPTPTRTDKELFADLCIAEFQLQPDVVSVKRLGQPLAGRVQPLLVYLKQAAQAKRLTDAAKQLRRSSDPTVRERVFINANLTKAEAAAAYQVRVQRRLAQQRLRGQPSSVRAPPPLSDDHAMLSDTRSANTNSSPRLNPLADSFLPPAVTLPKPTA
jgi:hypothetical protein